MFIYFYHHYWTYWRPIPQIYFQLSSALQPLLAWGHPSREFNELNTICTRLFAGISWGTEEGCAGDQICSNQILHRLWVHTHTSQATSRCITAAIKVNATHCAAVCLLASCKLSSYYVLGLVSTHICHLRRRYTTIKDMHILKMLWVVIVVQMLVIWCDSCYRLCHKLLRLL